MGNKRDFDEVGAAEPGSPEPSSTNDAAPFKKQKRNGTANGNSKARHRPNEGTSQYAKKRVRNIERLLNRNQDLPANVRNDLERELAAHKTSVTDKAHQKKRAAMITKYHMVRFFERKKAMRLGKQIRKKLQQDESSEDKAELERLLHIAEVDEAYTQNFPHIETYISLYKTEMTKETDEEDKEAKTKALLEAERPPMWSTIEKAMKGGPSALRAIRERRAPENSTEASRPERRQQQKTKAPAKTQPKEQTKESAVPQKQNKDGQPVVMNRRERRRLMREAAPAEKDDGDDSDGGGFFEES
ncbi:hypothetical protein B0T10DRAFT_475836 [Thelonectria olida]|uniref:rRNA-processing protein EFG1 n=1 Tax=Thelonectria olida TaxID=1576542 RepID=A0A9P9AU79_9HYPO|nr:hypothetical protein B0T10DRAFT_475836 [Thelonectria olida]